MKLIIPRNELKTALDGLSKVVPRKTTLPVLQCIRIEATDGRVQAFATDLDQAVSYRFEYATIEGKPIAWLVELEQLKGLADGNGERIEIEAQTGDAATAVKYIGGHPTTHALRLHDPGEWPEIRSTVTVAEVDSSFTAQYRKALAFSSTDSSRYVLNGVYLDVSDKKGHYVVATDGRRLTALNTIRFPLTESLILPSSRFLLWIRLAGDTAIGAGMRGDTRWFRLTAGNWEYSVKAVDRTYPNWRQVIPAEAGATTVHIGASDAEMLKSVLRTFPGHDVANAPIRLSKRAGKLIVSGKGAEDKAWTDLELPESRMEGKDQSIGVGRKYLLDALHAGFSTFTYADAYGPLMARNETGVHVLMPIRLSEDVPIETSKPTEEKTMKETACKGADAAASALDRLLAAYEIAKAKIREANEALGTIAGMIKEVLREDKQRRAEIDSVRAGLAKLQTIKV